MKEKLVKKIKEIIYDCFLVAIWAFFVGLVALGFMMAGIKVGIDMFKEVLPESIEVIIHERVNEENELT
jgi:hypothetical protein